jgi:hypothetical protein
MIVRLMHSLFTPKYPMFYLGRHRRCLIRVGAGRVPAGPLSVDEPA